MRVSLAVWLACSAAAPAAQPEPRIDFQRDVWPLLQARCVTCHGPEKQKGKLRLDSREMVMTKGGVSGAAIKPSKPDHSLLYLRAAGLIDGEDAMPPEGEPLSKAELELLRNWIEQGALWPVDVGEKNATIKTHWSYIKPARPALPAVRDRAWPRNAIDAFVFDRIVAKNLKPSVEEEPARLLRRVYLDLIGLPPSTTQVDAFIKAIETDGRDSAYERVVDQLLASPRYGEHWARHWLDLARYADSNGFQRDGHREIWAYRDWVIRAFNDDLPFDQFTIAQLAGDLLADQATSSQSVTRHANTSFHDPVSLRIATGFHRGTTVNVEAGTDPEEDRVKQVVDRVNTTATVFLGTTLACAQCHNHKYDPISQKEYYQFFAYFNNTEIESQRRGPATLEFVGPSMKLSMPDDSTAKRQALSTQLEERKSALEKLKGEIDSRLAAWEVSLNNASPDQTRSTWHALDIADFNSTGGAEGKILGDKSLLVSGARPDTDTYTLTIETDLTNITAFKLETLTDASLPGQGPGRHHPERPNFVLNEFTVTASPKATARNKKEKSVPVALTGAEADFSQEKWDVQGAIDGDPKTGWGINPAFHKPHHATFKTTKPVGFKNGTTLTFTLDQDYGDCRTIGRLRLSALTGSAGSSLPANIASIVSTPASKRTPSQTKSLRDHYLKQDTAILKLEAEVASLTTQLDALPTPSTLVMVELKKPRESFVMKRGDFLQPGERVSPGSLSSLHAMDADAPPNRLGLAQWIASKENPLLARVTVNRWWAQFFGRGIVATLEDFGTQGDQPTHPQLLDWLAAEFANPTAVANAAEKNGAPAAWSMKHIHRLIVTSATYRQSSRISPMLLEADPHNELLARGPRFRLPAEAIRDNALAIAGLLSDKMFGPPVYPPQPDGIWRVTGAVDNTYRTSQGEDRYRRGIYTVLRRSAPYPSFLAFDGTARGECTVSRPRTNTALAALTLLNDPVYVECAAKLAQRLMSDSKMTTAQRAELGMRLCVARKPTAREIHIITQMYEEELARFKKNPAAAKELLQGVKMNAGTDANELAAWTMVASALLNLDETITKG